MTGEIESTAITEQQPQRHLARSKKIAIIVALAVIALVLAIPVANWVSDPATHASTIQSLDSKAKEVMEMTAGSAAASAAITAIPGGFGSTIATKLIDVTSGFAVVLGALYLEKYLLTILCLAALRVAAPIAAVAAAIAVAFWENDRRRSIAGSAALKLALVALAMVLVIPTSTFVSNLIEDTYNASAQVATAPAQSDEDGDASSSDQAAATSEPASVDQTEPDADASPIQQIINAIRNITNEAVKAVADTADEISKSAQDVLADAEAALNQMIEKMVIMIVVDCVIPILVVIFYIWLVNLLLGTSFKLSKLPVGKATSGLKSAVSARKNDRD